jgi:hypothetical protein
MRFLIPVGPACGFLVYAALLHHRGCRETASRVLSRKIVVAALLLLFLVAALVVYPIADGRKAQGMGSDQDDALILTCTRLLSGQDPFNAVTYLGNAPSPGPGWVILVAPLVALHGYVLLTPIFLTLLVLLLDRMASRPDAAGLALVLFATSPLFWEWMVIGSDFIAIGILFVLVLAGVHSAWGRKPGISAISVALAVAAVTSRVIFVWIVPLIAVLLRRRGYGKAAAFVVAVVVPALALHLYFYSLDPAGYSPFHLLNKGPRILGPLVLPIAACATLGVGGWMALRARDELASWALALWAGLAVPLGFVGFSDLFRCAGDFAAWEGAGYLLLTTPLAVAWFVLTPDPGAASATTASGDRPILRA